MLKIFRTPTVFCTIWIIEYANRDSLIAGYGQYPPLNIGCEMRIVAVNLNCNRQAIMMRD